MLTDHNVSDLLDNWTNGNKSYVIDALANDLPGLTAMFLVTGITEKRLTQSDCNHLTNRLIDIRMGAFEKQDN